MDRNAKSVIKKITVLHPFPAVWGSTQKAGRKLRAAAYCRVSGASEEQLTSYHHQVRHYESYIKSHPDYELSGIYADEGISGTGLVKREGFLSLMEAAREGQIDLIITKSMSRFGRNTLDSLNNLRELKALGVDVYFEKENIHTKDSEGELLLTLLAAIAQNESFNQSENVKWGIRRQYERGNVKSLQASKFLGYKKGRDGYLYIDEEKAATVRRIYQLFLNGFGTYQIAMMLTREKVAMAYGGKEWCASHIQKVLTNEKFQGDTKFQKTFNEDYLTKRRVKNTGQLPQYYCKNTHPAIIDRDTWSLIPLEMVRQKAFVKDHQMSKFHFHSEDIPLSGKIICGQCSRLLLLRETGRIASENNKYWKCSGTLKTKKNCTSKIKLVADIPEQAIITAWNRLLSMGEGSVYGQGSKLIVYRQERLRDLLREHGVLETMPYDLLLKVLDHIELHAGFMNVVFLGGNTVRVDLAKPAKSHPRWTHTRAPKSQMAIQRMALGLTQKELAEKVKVTRCYFQAVESGRARPSPELVQRINDILYGEGDSTPSTF